MTQVCHQAVSAENSFITVIGRSSLEILVNGPVTGDVGETTLTGPDREQGAFVARKCTHGGLVSPRLCL